MNFDAEWQFDKIQYDYDMLFADMPISKNKNNELAKNLEYKDVVKNFNKDGYRCNDFIKAHNGKHIVFSGCSVTWGSGLNIEETWTHKLYTKISNKEKCSGYFNLAIPGSSIMLQIVTLFKYFKTYGNPDIIFINFPDPLRFFDYSKNNKIIDAIYKDDALEFLSLICYQYYFMLEQYCISNNIKLFSFTWDSKTKEYPLNIFKTFYQISNDETLKFVFNFIQNNKGDNLEFARDKSHFGVAYHEYWSTIMYEKYLEQ